MNENKLYKQIAELTVNKNADYYETLVSVLKTQGFIVILKCETTSDKYYIIAKEMEYE